MQTSILSSTALLTLLLAIGLVFFIRASTKDRTEVVKLVSAQPTDVLLLQVQTYLNQRAYHQISPSAAEATASTEVGGTEDRLTFEGFVRPSIFLTIFLTGLAAIGIFCITLGLAIVWPNPGQFLPLLTLLSPLAGVFYWRTAARPETVSFQVQAVANPNRSSSSSTLDGDSSASAQSVLTVTAHRDELLELQRSLALTPWKDMGNMVH